MRRCFTLLLLASTGLLAVPSLTVNPSNLNFTAPPGSTQPINQFSTLRNNGTQSNFTCSDDRPWLSVSPTSGTINQNQQIQLTITFNPTGFKNGDNDSGSVTCSAPGSPNAVISVGFGINGAEITLSDSSVTLTAVVGQMATTSVGISRVGGGATQVAANKQTGGNWLTVTQNSANTPTNFTINADATGLTPGTLQGSVVVSCTGNLPCVPKPVSITFTVTANTPVLSLSTSAFSFSTNIGSTTAQTTNVNLRNDGLPTNFTIASYAAWLTVTPSSGSIGQNQTVQLTVRGNPTGLTAATNPGTLTITSTAPALTISVSFNIQGGSNLSSQIFPHFAEGEEWQTDFLLTNLNATSATVELRFHIDDGLPTLSIQGVGSVGAIQNIVIPSMGSVSYRTSGNPLQSLLTGWAEVISQLPINGTALFRRHPSDGKYYEGSIPLAAPSSSFTIPFDGTTFTVSGDLFYTGLAIANPSAGVTAQVNCSAFDTSGTFLAGNLSVASLTPLAHKALIVQTTDPVKSVIGTRRGILVCSSTSPVAVLGLRAFGLAAISSLPIITSPATSVTALFPHFADGEEWQTEFLLINLNPGSITVQLKFHPDVGTTLDIQSMGRVTSIANIPIPANGSAFYRTAGNPQADLNSGWVEVVSTGPLNGVALFRRRPPDGKYYEGSIPLAAPSLGFTIPFDGSTFSASGDATYTALALVNPGGTSVSETCSAYSANGSVLGTSMQIASLGALGHTALTLQTTAPVGNAISNSRGILVCSSLSPTAVLGLRALGLAAISSLPLILRN